MERIDINFGLKIGATLTNSKRIALNWESRFIDERATTLELRLRI